MRFLKKKLRLVSIEDVQSKEKELENLSTFKIIKKKITKTPEQTEFREFAKRNRVSGVPRAKYSDLCVKNAAKNFGRAICNFIVSKLGDPYLTPLVKAKNIEVKKYKSFIANKKNTLDGIDQFRELLLPSEEDSQEIKDFKFLFQQQGEIFIKYFSVNWIFDGRLSYKQEYLKFRHKMLRRIKNPHLFTYIK
jgi:hypothetical protein